MPVRADLTMANFAILITGSGVIMNAILSAYAEGKIKNAIPRIVISSSAKNEPVLRKVRRKYGIKTAILNFSGRRIPDKYLSQTVLSNKEQKMTLYPNIQKVLYERWQTHDQEIRRLLQDNDVTPKNGLICLAEYRLLLSPQICRQYKGRILNIHPSLLPSFPGWKNVLEDTLNHGVKVTGVTVHIVNEMLDSGPIVSQVPVPIFDDDDVNTVRERLLGEACQLYPYSINLFAATKIREERPKNSKEITAKSPASCWRKEWKNNSEGWSFLRGLG